MAIIESFHNRRYTRNKEVIQSITVLTSYKYLDNPLDEEELINKVKFHFKADFPILGPKFRFPKA